MLGTTFAAYVRERTKTNTTTLSDERLALLANVAKEELAQLIATNVDEKYFDMEMVRDLEADTRDYTWEDSIIKNSRYVAAKLDGTNWVYLAEASVADADYARLPLMEEAAIQNFYQGRKAEYLITGRSLRIVSEAPIIAVTEGLKIVCEVYPEDITETDLAAAVDLSIPSSDTTHRLPRAAHTVWAAMVINQFKTGRDKPLPLKDSDAKLELDLSELYKTLRKRNAVRSIIAKVPYNDGQNY